MILVKNNTDIPFITSDEPVIISDKNNLNRLNSGGLLSPWNTIIIPFNPMYCIILGDTFPLLEHIFPNIDKNNFKRVSKKLENNEGFLNEKIKNYPIHNKIKGRSLVYQINLAQYKNSYRYILANNESILKDLIDKVHEFNIK